MTLSRRRFLTIASAACLTRGADAAQAHRIRFQALGADCQITLPGDRVLAQQAVQAVRSSIEAIEQGFSLYRSDSELSRLNRDGYLPVPSQEFLAAARIAQKFSHITNGAFDVTVQSLWRAHAEGRSTSDAVIDWRAMQITVNAIRFHHPDMSATFNGIAQGLATDRAITVLRSFGYRDVLANLGEFNALGQNPFGQPWRIGVQHPLNQGIAAVLHPTPQASAIATSEPQATLIADAPHIFDPIGRSGPRWASVTVRTDTATRADAISTAVAASPMEDAQNLLTVTKVAEAILIDGDGRLTHWRA